MASAVKSLIFSFLLLLLLLIEFSGITNLLLIDFFFILYNKRITGTSITWDYFTVFPSFFFRHASSCQTASSGSDHAGSVSSSWESSSSSSFSTSSLSTHPPPSYSFARLLPSTPLVLAPHLWICTETTMCGHLLLSF